MKPDWNKIFGEAHLHSWPTAGLCIQNVNPSPSQGSRNIFAEDKPEIMAAAKAHGYVLSAGGRIVSFMRPGQKRKTFYANCANYRELKTMTSGSGKLASIREIRVNAPVLMEILNHKS